MHRQSIASRSHFGQSSAQTATAQALRNKKREYEAISALEQSCAELIATLEDMATDLNTTAEATIGAIYPPSLSSNVAEWCFGLFHSYREGNGTLDGYVPDSQHKSCVEIRKTFMGLCVLNLIPHSRSLERTRSTIASKPSGSPTTRYFTRETGG